MSIASIAESLTALENAKQDIAEAITAKGGIVGTGDGFADFAADIGTISGGGGGSEPVIEEKNITSNGTYTAPAGVDGYSPVKVNVPTGPAKSASDVTVSGATVTVPAGLYSSAVKKNVASGLVDNPTATKGISGTTATFSPSVTIHEGYVLGTTKLGQPQTVTAAELDTLGTKFITENGNDIDVVGYEYVNVNVPTGPAKSASDVTVSGKTVTVPAGLYASQVQKSVADGTEGTPTASKSISGHTATITPSVTNAAGYITGGTKTGSSVTVSVSELESGTKTITENGTGIDVSGFSKVDVSVSGGGGGRYNIVSTDNGDGTQDIAITDASAISLQNKTVTENGQVTADDGYVGLGTVTVNVPQSTFTTKTITTNGTYNASSDNVNGYSSVTVNVPTSKNIQYSPVVSKITNNTNYTTTNSKITVAKTGTYKCSWIHYASASGNTYYLTQLYVNNSAAGSTHASPAYNGTSGWTVTESSISLTAGQTVEVRARTRSGTNYYTVAGMLVIEEV